MASTNKTQNLKLPQWKLTDKPEMKDFNEAFENIETEMAKKANIGTPTIYDLKLSEGFQNRSGLLKSFYYKTSENIVNVCIHVKRADGGVFKNGDVIGYLPEGFRPLLGYSEIGIGYTDTHPSTGTRSVAMLAADRTTGAVEYWNMPINEQYERNVISGSFSFLTDQ